MQRITKNINEIMCPSNVDDVVSRSRSLTRLISLDQSINMFWKVLTTSKEVYLYACRHTLQYTYILVHIHWSTGAQQAQASSYSAGVRHSAGHACTPRAQPARLVEYLSIETTTSIIIVHIDWIHSLLSSVPHSLIVTIFLREAYHILNTK